MMMGDTNFGFSEEELSVWKPLRGFSRWIPVEKATPSDGQRVLVYYASRKVGDSEYDEWIAVTYYWDDDKFWYPGEGGYAQPTHWAELPAPPLPGEQE
jgi:hypothetical protein